MLITTNVVILSQNQIPQLIKQIEKSVFTVLSIDENDNEFSQGSGFFISSNGIGVTNYHVLDGAYNAKIKLSTGEIIPIESICDYDKNADIVIFNPDEKWEVKDFESKATNTPFIGEDRKSVV